VFKKNIGLRPKLGNTYYHISWLLVGCCLSRVEHDFSYIHNDHKLFSVVDQ